MQRLLLLSLMFVTFSLNATLPDGSIAEDWTLDDIDGNTHSLYSDYLDQGWSVVLDMSATWCGPCWNFHQSGVMEDIYHDYGPSGEELIMPMMIEVDPNTNQACLYGSAGCNNSTIGNWTTGVDYPIFNPISSVANTINNDYNVTAYPTMYVISPSGWVKAFVGSGTSYDDIESWGAFSFQMENTTYTVDAQGCGDDSIDLHPEGGLGSISYEWSNGETTEDISGLASGEYFCTMTDDNGYEWVVGPIDVSGYEVMTFDEADIYDVDCYGNDTGTIDIEIGGGSGSFTYDWSHGGSGANLTGLFAGTYHVTVIDNNSGCEIYDSYPIYEPDEIEVIYQLTPVACGQTYGEIEFDNDGGTYPFTYIIDGDFYDYDVIELEAGSYTADITDAQGCTAFASFTIDQTVAPTSTASSSGNLSCTNTSVTLNGAGSSTGGSVVYAWYDGNGVNIGSSLSISVTNPDNYTLSVIDNDSGCSSSSSVSVSSNTSIPAAAANSSNNLTCNNPSTTLSASGSATGPNITYLWTTTNGSITGANNTMSISVNTPGTYNVLVSDTSNGCNANATLEVTQSALPSISSTGSMAFCQGSSSNICVPLAANETIQWTENGVVVGTSSCYTASSTATYIVMLTNSSTGCSTSQTVQTTAYGLPMADISGQTNFCTGASTTLCYNKQDNTTYEWMVNSSSVGTAECITVNVAGNVELRATSTPTGCFNSSTATINQNALPTASIATPSSIDCNNSSVALDLTTNSVGGTFAWYDQGGTLISNSEDITVSQAGTYTAYVTNTSGCEVSTSMAVTADTSVPVISIDQPSMIDCANPSTDLNLNLNNTNYTISWYDGSGNLLSNMEDISVSNAGTYTAVVSNTAGCETQAAVVVTADTSIPSLAIATPASLDCNTSAVVLDATIANGSSLTWTDAAGNVVGTSEDVTVTMAGTYNLTVLNAAGCSVTDQVVVNQINNTTAEAGYTFENNEFEFIFTNTSIGQVTSYEWTFGDGATSTEVNPAHIYTIPGYYDVCLETTNECGTTTTCTEVLAVAQLSNSVVITNVSCTGANDGAAEILIEGGLPGYTYQWSDPTLTGSMVSGLTPGIYSVMVTDETGMQSTIEVSISEPDPISVNADILSTSSSTSNGSITLNITGGTGAYEIVWSDGGDGTNLPQGEYTATITDANGCSITETFSVTGGSNVNEIDGLTNFNVSPNPTTEFVNVTAAFDAISNVQVSILSTVGQRQILTRVNTNNLNYRVDLSAYATGIYFIELRSEGKVSLKKIMVTK